MNFTTKKSVKLWRSKEQKILKMQAKTRFNAEFAGVMKTMLKTH